MSALETYCKYVVESRGLEHLRYIENLRSYLRQASEEDLLLAIRRIDQQRYLRCLVEAGLNPTLMSAVLSRASELIEQRR